MPLSFSDHGTFSDDGTTIASSSFTPPNNSLLVIIGARHGFQSGLQLSVSDSVGLSWTSRVTAITDNGTYAEVIIATAPVTTGVSMTVSVDSAASAFALGGAAYSYTGYDTGAPVGQTGSDPEEGDGSGGHSFNLGGSPAATSEVLAVAMGDGVWTFAPDTGWSEIDDLEFPYGDDSYELMFQTQRRGSSTSAAVSWGTATGLYRSLFAAIEIQAAAGGSLARSFGVIVG